MIEVCFRRGLFARSSDPSRPTPDRGPSDTHDAALQLGRELLARHGGASCRITVHANRREVLRWQLQGPDPHVEVHWALLERPEAILEAIADTPGARARLLEGLPIPHPGALNPRGSVHDLEALLIPERPRLPQIEPPPVTWGRWPSIPPVRRLRLGSCALPPSAPLIRIHPVLDHQTVPAWFVGFVLFHELLHVAYPPEVVGSRRWLHPPAFRRAEATHPHHERAEAWEKAHLRELLARCRRRLGASP